MSTKSLSPAVWCNKVAFGHLSPHFVLFEQLNNANQIHPINKYNLALANIFGLSPIATPSYVCHYVLLRWSLKLRNEYKTMLMTVDRNTGKKSNRRINNKIRISYFEFNKCRWRIIEINFEMKDVFLFLYISFTL